jgi:O-antigen/teichoic acid export membrane protein
VAVWFLRGLLTRFRPHHLSFRDAATRVRDYFPAYQRVFYRRGLRQVDRLVIALMLPLAEMANYHLARQLAYPLKYVTRGLADPLTVRLAADKDLDHHARDRRVYHAVAILVPLAVAVLSPWLMQVVYGPEYAAAWPIMAVLAAGFVFYGLSEYQLAVVVMLGDGEEPVGLEAMAGLVGIAVTIGMIAAIGEFGAPSGQMVQFVLLYLGGRLVTRRMLSRTRDDSTPDATSDARSDAS